MKLKKIDSLNYKCDRCGMYRKHKDMFDESICYVCWGKENINTGVKIK